MKQNFIFTLLALFSMLSLVSCSDWTETEALDSTVKKPWEQDPALWAEYTATLRAYKQSEHFIVYARMHNSPEKATGEQDFMRCLPDSLDIVTLTNADNFSKFDAEDMSVMHEKGTKVLYQIDYAARAEEFADAAALDYRSKLDITAGLRLVEIPGCDLCACCAPHVARTGEIGIIKLLDSIHYKGGVRIRMLLVFEGNPLSLAATDRAKMDYVILDTEKLENVLDVRLHALHAVNYAGIEANRLLLTAEINAALFDEDRTEHAAVDEMSRRVVELGPYAGLAAYNIAEDYYHSEMNYQTIRQAIQTLNPSK